jgi:hypothetical protein
MRKAMLGLAIVAAMGLVAQSASAQRAGRPAAARQGYGPGYMDIGPTAGFGGLGEASTAFGARFEMALKPLPSLGNGMLGLQIGATYASWSNQYASSKVIPIGVTANYHFRLADSKIDPFVGLGLGYQIVTCTVEGLGSIGCGSNEVYFIGRAGVRYFLTPKLALYGDVGAGGATVNVGVMLKLR